MSNRKLKISEGTKKSAQMLIDKICALYQHLSWTPVYVPTDDGHELRGYKASFNGATVEIKPLWWGTWIGQYKDGHTLNYFAIHTGHRLYSKIKTVYKFADRHRASAQNCCTAQPS